MKLIDILLQTKDLNNPNHLIGTDKNTIHSYIDYFYESELIKYKDKFINLLEIGMSSGGSLFLWRQYFANAKIYGLDIMDVLRPQYKNLKNTEYIINNAYDINFMNSLPNFDIIIDDGPHSLDSQLFTLINYSKKLNSNGILIIEDIDNQNNLDILVQNIPQEYKDKFQVFDLRSIKNRYDDIIIVLRNEIK
jgi:hypothetical protein